MTILRRPVVAGRFYPGEAGVLEAEVAKLMPRGGQRSDAIAVVSPHAGYIFSGHVAGAVFSQVNVPSRVVVMGPNHTGYGARAAVMPHGAWETPLGRVELDAEFASLLMEESGLLESDVQAHAYEHSLEVQVPFLQAAGEEFKLVPICLQYLTVEECLELGGAVARAVGRSGGDTLLVASTDMTHYEPDAQARAKDRLALEKIEALDPKGLYEVVRANSISMCGVIPTTVVLAAARELGARTATLVRYATSGEVSGDFDQVVGYAGFVIS